MCVWHADSRLQNASKSENGRLCVGIRSIRHVKHSRFVFAMHMRAPNENAFYVQMSLNGGILITHSLSSNYYYKWNEKRILGKCLPSRCDGESAQRNSIGTQNGSGHRHHTDGGSFNYVLAVDGAPTPSNYVVRSLSFVSHLTLWSFQFSICTQRTLKTEQLRMCAMYFILSNFALKPFSRWMLSQAWPECCWPLPPPLLVLNRFSSHRQLLFTCCCGLCALLFFFLFLLFCFNYYERVYSVHGVHITHSATIQSSLYFSLLKHANHVVSHSIL